MCTLSVVRGLETARHLWESQVQSHEWRLAWLHLQTWLGTYVGP